MDALMLPDDMKDLGAFQFFTPDECVLIICCLAVYAGIFWPYIF